MAIIDPNGLFGGDRICACSDEAQLNWPRLLVSSNSYGRFEIGYQKIVAAAYGSFKNKPSEDDLMGWVREYRDNFLLFIYEAPDGSIWGQWMTDSRYLKSYQTAEDKRSPAPNPKDVEDFRRAYVESKKRKLNRINDLLKPLQSFSNHSEPDGFTRLGEGVGVGEGVGEKDSCPAETPDVPATEPQPDDLDAKTESAVIEGAFQFYCKTLRRDPSRYSLTPERRKKALLRLRDRVRIRGNLEDAKRDIAQCIRNLAASEYHVSNGHVDWTDHIFKSAEMFEKRLNWKKGEASVGSHRQHSNSAPDKQARSLAAAAAADRTLARNLGLDDTGFGELSEPGDHGSDAGHVEDGMAWAGGKIRDGTLDGRVEASLRDPKVPASPF